MEEVKRITFKTGKYTNDQDLALWCISSAIGWYKEPSNRRTKNGYDISIRDAIYYIDKDMEDKIDINKFHDFIVHHWSADPFEDYIYFSLEVRYDKNHLFTIKSDSLDCSYAHYLLNEEDNEEE